MRVVQLCACSWALVLSGTGADLPLSVKKPIQRLSLAHTSLPAPTPETTLGSACKTAMVEGAGSTIQHTKVTPACLSLTSLLCLFRHGKSNTTACSDFSLGWRCATAGGPACHAFPVEYGVSFCNPVGLQANKC